MPPEVLEILFEFLEPKQICGLTECCKKFKAIVENSDRLTKKLTLFLRYPMDLNSFSESIINSKRRYRKLSILKSRDRLCYEAGRSSDVVDVAITNRLFRKLGEMIRDLSVDWSYAMRPREASLFDIVNRRHRGNGRGPANMHDPMDNFIAAQTLSNVREDIYNEFVHLIRFFTNVQRMLLFNVHLEKSRQPNEPVLSFPKLRELSCKQCDAFCFDVLSSCTLLTKLTAVDPWWNSRSPGIDTFEHFLINQTALKSLKLKNFQYPRLFQVDRTNDIAFKLEVLVLESVFFADKDIANRFFRTQNKLRTIDFQLHNEKVRPLDDMQWYNNILKSIVGGNNRELHTVRIEKLRYRIDDCDFIRSNVNPFVKKLKFKVTAEDKSSELFKILIRMFPNLEEIDFKAEESEETDCGICFDEGTVLERARSLTVTNSSVRSLVNCYAGSLSYFEYVPGKTGEFIDDLFGAFFHRHRNIKQLVIGSRSERSYFFISYNLCQLIVSFLTQLESITVFNFGEVNKSVKLLCNLPKLKTLTLSTEDYQQFTAKTKVECARVRVQLVHIKIPNHVA